MYDTSNAIARHFQKTAAQSEQMEMVKTHLFNMAKQAQALHSMLGDQDEVPEWVQEKVAVSCNMLDSVHDYLMPKMAKKASYGIPLAVAGGAGLTAAAMKYRDHVPRAGGISRDELLAHHSHAQHRAERINEGKDPDKGLRAKWERLKVEAAAKGKENPLTSSAVYALPIAGALGYGTHKALKAMGKA
jgi:hypothetical protein